VIEVHLVWCEGLTTVSTRSGAPLTQHVSSGVLALSDALDLASPITPVVGDVGGSLVPAVHASL
jgi:hypothetical protein